MVKVEPPEGWTSPDDHHALDEADVRRAPSSLVSESTIHRQARPIDNTFGDAVDLLAGRPVPATNEVAPSSPRKSVAPTKKSKSLSPSQAPPAGNTDAPLLPNADWTSAASKKKLLVGSAIAAALLLCIGVVAIGRALITDDVEPNTAVNKDEVASRPIKEAEDNPAVDATDVTSKPRDDSVGSAKTAEPNDDEKVEVEPADKQPPDDVTADHSPVTPLPERPEDKVDRGTPKTPIGPPGLVDKDDDDFTGPSLLAELDKFSELIGDPTIASGTPEADELADILTPREVPFEGPALPRPAVRDVDVAARLKDPLPGIEFADVPLDVFVRFVSDFSTIPISLTPEALTQRQITPRSLVSIRSADTTVGTVLSVILSSHELGYVERDKQLVIVATGSPKFDSLREVEYDLSDISTDSADDTKRIAAWIVELVSPKTWQVNGGAGVLDVKGTTLAIQQTEPIHFQVLMLCEKLRVARGLSPRSSYPAAVFRLETRSAKCSEALERPISMNYLDDVRFVEILQRAQEQAGVNILVDWHALAEAGWNPDAQFPFSVDKKPLREMLAELLGRMELTYRIADANTIQITTDKRLMDLAEVEFYPAADLVTERTSAEQLVTGVKSTLGEVHFLDHAGAICFDSKSRYLIVALPQPQQQVVARILTGLPKRGSRSAE